jgi:phage-related protein
MPKTRVVFFREDDGSVPVLDWLGGLAPKPRLKCLAKIERLRELGHELRRPEADYLRDGIYELRVSLQGIQYRLLYFFYGTVAAVLSHGIVKEQAVPGREIERAVEQRERFKRDPEQHSAEES